MAFFLSLFKKGFIFFLYFSLVLLLPLFSQVSTYEVQKGDTLYSIARKNNTTVDKIIELNRLNSNVPIKIGQKLKIPPVTASAIEWENYTVLKGDTLYSLAKRYRISQEELLKKNNLKDGSFLILGKKIWVPKQEKMLASNDGSKKIASDDKKNLSNKGERSSSDSSLPVLQTPLIPQSKGSRLSSAVQWPTKGKVFRLKGKVEGVVIESKWGEPVVSISSGTVIWAAPFRGYGKMVVVQSKGNYTYTYCCNEQIYVKVGDKVSNGVKIGSVGVGSHDQTPKLILLTHKGEKPVDPVKAPRQ